MFKKLNQLIVTNIQGNHLKARMSRAALWSLVGYGGSTIIRMVSSLILTRIFLPDVFGIMAIVTSIAIGVELLSDIGLGASIIQNKNGEEPFFLRTAWTIQVLRGFILWIILCLISYPASEVYNEPLLVLLIPVMGLQTIIKGFCSTSRQLYQKWLIIDKPIILNLTTQTVGVISTILLAVLYKSIWAFIAGILISSLVNLIGSYLYLKGGVQGFELDKEAKQEIIQYGKWIVLATMISYLVSQGDRLVIGAFVSKTQLGLYNLAVLFSVLPISFLNTLVSQVLMPGLAEVDKNDSKKFTSKFIKLQKLILLIMVPVIFLMSIFGNVIIEFLYNDNYKMAGPILQILSLGAFASIISMTFTPVFLAKGDSVSHMYSSLFQGITYFFCLFAGYYLANFNGVIIGIAIAPYLWLQIIYILSQKHIQTKYQDIMNLTLSFVPIVLGIWYTFNTGLFIQ